MFCQQNGLFKYISMKKYISLRHYIFLVIIAILPVISFSQVVISERSVIHIDNIRKATPEIRLIQPEIFRGETKVLENDLLKVLGRMVNGNEKLKIIVNNKPAILYGDSLFSADITLVPGQNPIKIEILSDNNVINSYTCNVFRNIKVTDPIAPSLGNGKYYALVIGINNYADSRINELDYALRDAEQFYYAITSKYIFAKENVKFLKNATMEEMVDALDFYSKNVRPEDNFLIFYAGHGIWDNSAEIGFWLPSDARKDSKLAWFRNSTLRDYLKSIKSKHTLLISDACFAGSIFKTRVAFADAPLAINKLYDLPSRKAMTSGTLTEVPDKSAFLKYLVDRLVNNTEKYLSSEQLFSSFRIAVINNSNAVPQFGEIKEVGDEGGDFIFILKNNN